MAVKFHISSNGTVGVCQARKGPCPLGGSEYHFNTREEAQAAADKMHTEEFGLLPGWSENELVLKTPEGHRKYIGDCTIISLGNALNMSYNQSDKMLRYIDVDYDGNYIKRENPRTKREYQRRGNLMQILSLLGDEVEMSAHPKFKDFRMDGKYIVLSFNHAAYIEDGVIYDAVDSRNNEALYAFKLNEEKINDALNVLRIKKT